MQRGQRKSVDTTVDLALQQNVIGPTHGLAVRIAIVVMNRDC